MHKSETLSKVIKKPSIANTVMQRITQAIMNREMKPGDLLPSEADLSESMGVGKSSVREAIKMLSIMGVVESVQGEGTFVRNGIDENGINPLVYQMILMQGSNAEIMELRKMFEPAYVLLAMRKATEQDIEQISETVERLEHRVGEHRQTAKDDLAFHEAILKATHNPYVIKIGQTVLQLFEASIRNSMNSIPERAVEDHRRILKAFLARDEQALLAAVYQSFEGWGLMLNSGGNRGQ